jgi:hypothetical protein
MKTGTKSRPLAKGLKTWWFPEFPDLPFLLLPLETAKSGKVLANEKAIFSVLSACVLHIWKKKNQTNLNTVNVFVSYCPKIIGPPCRSDLPIVNFYD